MFYSTITEVELSECNQLGTEAGVAECNRDVICRVQVTSLLGCRDTDNGPRP